jgi:hypothetical protein
MGFEVLKAMNIYVVVSLCYDNNGDTKVWEESVVSIVRVKGSEPGTLDWTRLCLLFPFLPLD